MVQFLSTKSSLIAHQYENAARWTYNFRIFNRFMQNHLEVFWKQSYIMMLPPLCFTVGKTFMLALLAFRVSCNSFHTFLGGIPWTPHLFINKPILPVVVFKVYELLNSVHSNKFNKTSSLLLVTWTFPHQYQCPLPHWYQVQFSREHVLQSLYLGLKHGYMQRNYLQEVTKTKVFESLFPLAV